jgi:hypothetical protein
MLEQYGVLQFEGSLGGMDQLKLSTRRRSIDDSEDVETELAYLQE